MTDSPAGWDDLLDGHTAEIAALARRLRAAVTAAFPDLMQRLYPGWHALGLRHPERGYLGGIFPRADEVMVVLEHGAALPDPHGLLRGSGKQVRHLSFRPGAAEPTEAHLIAYLDLAIDRRS